MEDWIWKQRTARSCFWGCSWGTEGLAISWCEGIFLFKLFWNIFRLFRHKFGLSSRYVYCSWLVLYFILCNWVISVREFTPELVSETIPMNSVNHYFATSLLGLQGEGEMLYPQGQDRRSVLLVLAWFISHRGPLFI
jgi:hypothetical protein